MWVESRSKRHCERVGVVGAGYVGLTTAAGLAHLGHEVTVVDVDAARVAALREGRTPLDEPDLGTMIRTARRRGLFDAVTDITVLRRADIVFVCVPTPADARGDADLSAVWSVLDALRTQLRRGSIIVLKSTVPVGTARRAAAAVASAGLRVVSNPEFLRESRAVYDFLHADRIVIGADDEVAADRVAALYHELYTPVHQIDFESAELAKYSANAFLATKLSFVNELAELCERVGADIERVGAALGSDPRIGSAFLAPGPGWGGSCLPKDTAALLRTAQASGVPMAVLDAAVCANQAQITRTVDNVRAVTGRQSLTGLRVSVLGLTFKAGTADLRDSPALGIAAALTEAGAKLVAYDPTVDVRGRKPGGPGFGGATLVDDPYEAVRGSEAIVIATEWPEFAKLDWCRVAALTAKPAVVDTRNLLDVHALRRDGFAVLANGR
jgi:UDPglucose 6-dehydrogenase